MITCIGIGPNDPELITVKALKAINNADVILGLKNQSEDIIEYYNIKFKTILLEYNEHKKFIEYAILNRNKNVVKFYNGDPSLYSEMFLFIHNLKCMNIKFEIIPGITSAFYASSWLELEYTIPPFLNDNARSLLITSYLWNPKFKEQIKGAPSAVIYMNKQESMKKICDILSDVYGEETKCIIFAQIRNGYLDYKFIKNIIKIKELGEYDIKSCGHNNMIIVSHSYNSIIKPEKIITDIRKYYE